MIILYMYSLEDEEKKEKVMPRFINPSKKQFVASNVHDTDSENSSSDSSIKTILIKRKIRKPFVRSPSSEEEMQDDNI